MVRTATVLLLLLAGASPAQSVKLPATINTPVNIPAIVGPDSVDGGTILWMLPDPGLTEIQLTRLFPASIANQATGRIFYATQPGRYRIWAVVAKGDKVSEKAETILVVGDAPPPVPPGPGPGPTPPGPTPGPVPIPGDGLRVLIVYDQSSLPKLPKGQLDVLYSGDVRDYLNTHCAKGADGKTAEWRMWDAAVPTGGESKTWQDAMARKRDKTPWLIVSNGKTGFEGPLPDTKDAALSLLKQYGGN